MLRGGVATGSGTISALDARSGALLRSVDAGFGAFAAAVDERTRRGFVDNTGGIVEDMTPRPTYAPKVPAGWIVQLYRTDAMGIRDGALIAKVGWRLHARCQDVLMVSASRVACPVCHTEFAVPWCGQPEDRVVACPGCGWTITAGAYHASFRHQDLLGANARSAFAEFVSRFPVARRDAERMLLIDHLVHALHTTGGRAARNLLEGNPARVLAVLDQLAGADGVARTDHSGDM